MVVVRRDWESRFYPFPIGHLPVLCALGPQTRRRDAYRRLLAWVNEEAGPELALPHLSCRVPVEDVALVHALEDSGFRHMSTMVQSYWKRPEVIQRVPRGWVVREAVDADWPHLGEIVRDILSSMLTRYTADPDLPASGTRALYEAWGAESRAKRFSAVNLVVVREEHASEPGRFDGFAFARFSPELGSLLGGKTGELTISGIQPAHRRHGAFNVIVPALLAWLWDHGAEHCAMLTQIQNYRSLRTAQRTENLIVGAHHCFHRWLGTGAA